LSAADLCVYCEIVSSIPVEADIFQKNRLFL
jgi:hypothetical protein